MKKFFLSSYGHTKVLSIEIVRETEKCIFVLRNGREHREMKQGSYRIYYDTENDALIAARNRLINNRSRAVNDIERAKHRVEDLDVEIAAFYVQHPHLKIEADNAG